jgi:hypothetical protein
VISNLSEPPTSHLATWLRKGYCSWFHRAPGVIRRHRRVLYSVHSRYILQGTTVTPYNTVRTRERTYVSAAGEFLSDVLRGSKDDIGIRIFLNFAVASRMTECEELYNFSHKKYIDRILCQLLHSQG